MADDGKLSYLRKDFILSKEARVLRIASEYLEPKLRFEKNNILHTVVFFGSARLKPNTPYYRSAEELAFRVTQLGDELEKEIGENVYICTGGGPGIMEAANKGAQRGGKKNIGLNIDLPYEQASNPYITSELNFSFNYFFTRKYWFLYLTKAVVVFPGGFGTMDELFETLTLIQTKKLEKFDLPILLYDKSFWYDLINWDKFKELGLISPEDMDMIYFFDDTEDAIRYMKPRLTKSITEFLKIHKEI